MYPCCSVLILIPSAVYEMYLCFVQFQKHTSNKVNNLRFLLTAIGGSMLWYMMFLWTLIIEIYNVRTFSVKEETDSLVAYEQGSTTRTHESTPDVVMHPTKKYTCLSVKIIGARFDYVKTLSVLTYLGQLAFTQSLRSERRTLWKNRS